MHYRTEMHEERRRTIKTLLSRRKTGLGQQRHQELLDTGQERCREEETGDKRCQEQKTGEGRSQGARSKSQGRAGGRVKHMSEDQGLEARATGTSCILVSVPGKQRLQFCCQEE